MTRRTRILIAIALPLVAAIVVSVIHSRREEARAAARARMEQEIATWFPRERYDAFFVEEGRPDLEPAQRLATPVLPVAVRGGQRFVYFGSDLARRTKLPIADSLANVGTVAISLETTSLYTLGALTYRTTIVFVDANSRAVIARKTFSSERPPERVTIDDMSQWDDRFWAPVATWINGLPLRD